MKRGGGGCKGGAFCQSYKYKQNPIEVSISVPRWPDRLSFFFSNEKTKQNHKHQPKKIHNNRIGKMSLLVPTSPEVRVVVLS